jgi:hypothetical protein
MEELYGASAPRTVFEMACSSVREAFPGERPFAANMAAFVPPELDTDARRC